MSPWWMGDGDRADAAFDDPAPHARQCAVVLLVTPEGTGDGFPGSDRPVIAGVAGRIRSWFADQGFSVEPAAGRSFSISGPRPLFARVFGSADPGPAAEYDRAALGRQLDADLLPFLGAVLTDAPDQGPG
jgi:hypothetical protein